MMDEREKILEVKNLTISFRTNAGMVRAVWDIAFDLYKGKTLALREIFPGHFVRCTAAEAAQLRNQA